MTGNPQAGAAVIFLLLLIRFLFCSIRVLIYTVACVRFSQYIAPQECSTEETQQFKYKDLYGENGSKYERVLDKNKHTSLQMCVLLFLVRFLGRFIPIKISAVLYNGEVY